MGVDAIIYLISIFVMAVFVGYYVVWSVTPALHTPLMSVTNAISSVIIVGALVAVGVKHWRSVNMAPCRAGLVLVPLYWRRSIYLAAFW